MLYYNTVDRRKAYDEVENNRLPACQNILCYTRNSIVQKLSNKQSAKVICRYDRLGTVHSKRQTSHMSIENLSATHAFNYIVLRGNTGLTSCEDLAMALYCSTQESRRLHNGYIMIT